VKFEIILVILNLKEKLMKNEWILVAEDKSRTYAFNLPNGCMIRVVTVWSNNTTETMQSIPDVNYNRKENKFVRI
jgi:hypothetical protein